MDYCKGCKRKNYVKVLAFHMFALRNTRSNIIEFNHFPTMAYKIRLHYINPTEIYLELYKHNKHYGRIDTFQNGLTVKFPIDPKMSLKIAQFFGSIPGVEDVCYSYDPAAARVMHLVVKHHFKLRPYMPFQC